MIDSINSFLDKLVGYLWGLPTVFLLVGSGLAFTIWLQGIQFRAFFHAIQIVRGKYDNPDDPGEITHFQALCTALSGTVGLGNIAGVAVAIKIGGPGATFWMILAGLLGMATKYTECSLAVMYRRVDENGVVSGGPMYYMRDGLGGVFKPLSYLFAICCIAGCIGAANMFQVNQVAASLHNAFEVPHLVTGIVFAVGVGVVIIGGIKRIGQVAGTLIPLMGGGYVLACLLIIVMHITEVPGIFAEIIYSAFNGTAAAGGFTGAAVVAVLRQGIQRAAFSNEAGMGTAAIAHSAAKTNEKVREGIVALLEPLVDTVVICTMTALVINITGVWTGPSTGVNLTSEALNSTLPGFGTYFIPIAVSLFAFSTMISWSYYGEQCVDYLFGHSAIIPFKIIFCCFAVVGAVWNLKPILAFSDSAIALMIFPNLLALWFLMPKVKIATDEYFQKLANGEFKKY
ncbi:UNVERIFIED_CONTAM: hypothetical protein GTU68_040155 [Idotea baltica]|nr:hypothetical protein [Idotea baltica]